MKGLRTTVYKVPDLETAKVWYEAAFETQPYFDEVFYVGFNIEGFELGLLPEENSISIRGENVIAYWAVDNIDKAYSRLIELGAEEHEKPNNVGDELMVASVFDPWGNIIGLIYNPYFKFQQAAS